MTAPFSPGSSDPSRRVLSRADALILGNKLLALVNEKQMGVQIESTARSVTKVVNGQVLHTDDGDQIQIRFASQFGSGLEVYITTDQFHDETFARIAALAKQWAPPEERSEDVRPYGGADDPDDPAHFTYQARDFPKVILWYASTSQGMETARGTVLPELIRQVQGSGLSGTATVGLAARSVLYLYRLGLTAFAEETDSEVTVTARTPDGRASGWAGQARRDWTQMTPNAVAQQAIEMANRARNPVAFEPGRRTVILGPAAVAQLVGNMAYAFSADATNKQGYQATPFSVVNYDATGKHNKVGRRVFDARLRMVSDPQDPLGGYPPFFEHWGIERQLFGYPTPAMTWIDHGVLVNLAYTVGGVGLRLVPNDIPRSVRLTTVPGTQTATIDEMVANCQEGVYVHRFTNVSLVHNESGMMTGSTRDGCFLIKRGKIIKPIKNFRFTDSPFFNFNNVEMIGVPERVAFGYSAPLNKNEVNRWPRLPMIVPPMMIRDFNFSALSDAV